MLTSSGGGGGSLNADRGEGVVKFAKILLTVICERSLNIGESGRTYMIVLVNI